MKARRHVKILELLDKEVIHTQEELADRLRQEGLQVTQATVSRDIKELGLIKVPVDGDGYRYVQDITAHGHWNKLKSYFKNSVLTISESENIIVIKTLPGTAPAVGAAIDSLPWDEILGSVAGDDTILVVVASKGEVAEISDKFHSLL